MKFPNLRINSLEITEIFFFVLEKGISNNWQLASELVAIHSIQPPNYFFKMTIFRNSTTPFALMMRSIGSFQSCPWPLGSWMISYLIVPLVSGITCNCSGCEMMRLNWLDDWLPSICSSSPFSLPWWEFGSFWSFWIGIKNCVNWLFKSISPINAKINPIIALISPIIALLGQIID